MKLKDLMNKYSGPLLIFLGDNFIGDYFTDIIDEDAPPERIARIICLESDTVISIQDIFHTPKEEQAIAKKVFECADLNVNKIYMNENDDLVVFVK